MSCSITDIKLDNISGVSIAPAFENNWAGRDFTIKCGGGTVNGLFSMNQLERRANELYKEVKGSADSLEKLVQLKNLREFVVTLDAAEDAGIALYENDEKIGCFFRFITTLFCRLFDLCSPSHKEYQANLKGKIAAKIAQLETANPSFEFAELFEKHDAALSKIGGGAPLANLKDAIAKDKGLCDLLKSIKKENNDIQLRLLTPLTQAFSRDEAIRQKAIATAQERLNFRGLDLDTQLGMIVAKMTKPSEVDRLCLQLANALNDPKQDELSITSPSHSKVVYWILEQITATNLPMTFGRYTDAKKASGDYKYTGLKAPTAEQEALAAFYFSPAEIKQMLQAFKYVA